MYIYNVYSPCHYAPIVGAFEVVAADLFKVCFILIYCS